MQIKTEKLKEIENSLARYFDAEPPAMGKNSGSYDQLFNRLKHQIEYLLRTSTERLWQGLYRIDVSEDKVKGAFKAGSLPDIATELAKLIIEREHQKAEIREKYNQNRD